MKYRNLIARALGARDCALGKKPMLKRQAYMNAYAKQYAKEQANSARSEVVI